MRLIDGEELYQIESLLKTDIVEQSKTANWLMGQVLHDIEATPTVSPESLPIVKQLRAELGKVKAERDAAVRDIKWLVSGEIKACAYCKKNNPYNYTCENDGMGMCEHWEWRGAKEG